MSHHLTVNQRKEFGKPPAHYKLVRPTADRPKLKAPDLDLLTSGDRDYHLVFQGQSHFKIPLKWRNPFLFDLQLPQDHPSADLGVNKYNSIENMSQKWTPYILQENGIEVDVEFLKQLSSDLPTFNASLIPSTDGQGADAAKDVKEPPRSIPIMQQYSPKLELKKMALKMHERFAEAMDISKQIAKLSM